MIGTKKQNRTSFHANLGMYKAQNTADRPEQLLIKEILEYHTTAQVIVTEKKVTYRTEFNDYRDAILDIFMKLNGNKYAIRVMGKAHDKKIRKMKDVVQLAYLEALKYIVIDIFYYDNEVTFKRNRTKLTEIELIQAFYEIKSIFGDMMDDHPSEKWLLNSEHKK